MQMPMDFFGARRQNCGGDRGVGGRIGNAKTADDIQICVKIFAAKRGKFGNYREQQMKFRQINSVRSAARRGKICFYCQNLQLEQKISRTRSNNRNCGSVRIFRPLG
jgi:hypothetical protein